MSKTFVSLAMVMLLLVGCSEPEQYKKIDGEVIGKFISNGRYGDSYYIEVSYPVGENGTFSVADVYVEEKQEYDSYEVKDKVTVFANEDGVGEILKK